MNEWMNGFIGIKTNWYTKVKKHLHVSKQLDYITYKIGLHQCRRCTVVPPNCRPCRSLRCLQELTSNHLQTRAVEIHRCTRSSTFNIVIFWFLSFPTIQPTSCHTKWPTPTPPEIIQSRCRFQSSATCVLIKFTAAHDCAPQLSPVQHSPIHDCSALSGQHMRQQPGLRAGLLVSDLYDDTHRGKFYKAPVSKQ